MEQTAALKLAQEREEIKRNLKQLDTKYNNTINLQIKQECSNDLDILFYWFWKGYLIREKEIKKYTNEVKKLREQKLITVKKEMSLLIEIDKLQDILWKIGIDILNEHKYTIIGGTEIVLNNVITWANAMLYLDQVIIHLKDKLGNEIKNIRMNVNIRDNMCTSEYKEEGKCDDIACEYYTPWFGLRASKAVCRSRIRS